MRIKVVIRAEDGFTIQELLVVIVLGVLLVGFCWKVFFFGQRIFRSWEEKLAVSSSVSGALQQIAADIRRSRFVDLSDPNTLEIWLQQSDKMVVYSSLGGITTRGDVRIHGDMTMAAEFRQDVQNDAKLRRGPRLRILVSASRGQYMRRDSTLLEVPYSSKSGFDETVDHLMKTSPLGHQVAKSR
jgi:Tfp pilus assembly protein PilW